MSTFVNLPSVREKSAIQDFYTLDEPGEESRELSSVGKR